MKATIYKFLSAALILGSVACHNQTKSNMVDSSAAVEENPKSHPDGGDSTANKEKDVPEGDVSFAKEAATGGLKEVELGKLAKTKASAPKVVQFAEMMVTDHTKANEALKA